MSTIKFILRKDRTAGDLAPLVIKITDAAGRRLHVSTGYFMPLSAWQKKTSTLAPGCRDYQLHAGRLDRLRVRADQYLAARLVDGTSLDAWDFTAYVLGKEQKKKDTYAAMLARYLDGRKICYKHERLYTRTGALLLNFRPGVVLSDVDDDFLRQFHAYIMREEANTNNAANKKIQCLKTVLRYAKGKGVKVSESITLYKLHTEETARNYLLPDELKALHAHYQCPDLPTTERQALGPFLFCCYTGLRLGDLKKFAAAPEAYLLDSTLTLQMDKTKMVVTVPLVSQARGLLDAGALAYVYSGQKGNQYLKPALKAVDITRPITYHCARHTFATVSLTLGIPVEVVQRLLGHTKIQTTMRYGRIVDAVKKEQMQKWEGL